MAWNECYVRSRDYFTCIQYIVSNPVGESIVWDYMRDHWPDLVKRFGLNELTIGDMIPSITGRFSTETELKEMESFLERYPEMAGKVSVRRALETVKGNIVWLETNVETIRYWLQNF